MPKTPEPITEQDAAADAVESFVSEVVGMIAGSLAPKNDADIASLCYSHFLAANVSTEVQGLLLSVAIRLRRADRGPMDQDDYEDGLRQLRDPNSDKH